MKPIPRRHHVYYLVVRVGKTKWQVHTDSRDPAAIEAARCDLLAAGVAASDMHIAICDIRNADYSAIPAAQPHAHILLDAELRRSLEAFVERRRKRGELFEIVGPIYRLANAFWPRVALRWPSGCCGHFYWNGRRWKRFAISFVPRPAPVPPDDGGDELPSAPHVRVAALRRAA